MPTADSQLQYVVPAWSQLASDGFNPKGGLFRVFLGRTDQGPEEGQVIIQAVVPRRTPLEFWQLPTPFSCAANFAGGANWVFSRYFLCQLKLGLNIFPGDEFPLLGLLYAFAQSLH